MRNSMTKTLLILLLVFVAGCIYFYRMEFSEHRQTYTVVERIPMMSTRQLTREQYFDLGVLSHDLREYYSTRSDILERKLFPWWLHRETDHNSKQYHDEKDTSKGIVICTGNSHFRLALVALRALELIGNELPIEVAFSTSNDLSLGNRQKLENLFPNVRLIDLSATSFNDSYLELRGWEIKPFAVLASRFRHVLLMDADVLFLEKPSILFENLYYLKTGSLFFYDRITLSEETTRWIRTLSTNNSDQLLPQFGQESGVVLIDKARVLAGLLSTCKLNDHQEREQVTYRRLYGDKDTWWLGFHLIKMPYSFIPTKTGSIGQVISNRQSNMVCGHILHLDENRRPIWWNGGMFRNRYVDVKQLLTIEGWSDKGDWQIKAYSCLTGVEQTTKQFSQHQQQLINGYLQITKKIFDIVI